ncbi:MAG: hypothetical protein ABI947_24545 [Chloroflexota bacterium]
MDDNGHLLEDVTFDGVFDDDERKWHKRDIYFGKVMEKFLIAHRNHELRFVPEGVDELLENKLGFISNVESNDVLKNKIVPEVNWGKEKEDWEQKLSKSRNDAQINGSMG